MFTYKLILICSDSNENCLLKGKCSCVFMWLDQFVACSIPLVRFFDYVNSWLVLVHRIENYLRRYESRIKQVYKKISLVFYPVSEIYSVLFLSYSSAYSWDMHGICKALSTIKKISHVNCTQKVPPGCNILKFLLFK